MAVASLTTDNFAEGVRKTTETPPRVSVYDIIAKVKGCSGDVACVTFRRLLATDSVPECGEVLQGMVQTNCLDHPARGGNQRPIFVATAQEMVESLCALLGSIALRKNCAQLLVSYLGGDLSLVQEIFQNRAV